MQRNNSSIILKNGNSDLCIKSFRKDSKDFTERETFNRVLKYK